MGRRGRPRGPYRVDEDDDGPVVTPRQAAHKALLDRLTGDSRVRAAALVAHSFGIDPIVVLDERDPLRADVRLAAHNALQNELAKANKRSK